MRCQFALLKPIRRATRYRNYSSKDVVLLRCLKEQLDAGGFIGELAKLAHEEFARSYWGKHEPMRHACHSSIIHSAGSCGNFCPP